MLNKKSFKKIHVDTGRIYKLQMKRVQITTPGDRTIYFLPTLCCLMNHTDKMTVMVQQQQPGSEGNRWDQKPLNDCSKILTTIL